MCLFTNQEKPKVCKTPIRCMKVVGKKMDDSGYLSPFCVINRHNVSYRVGYETSIVEYERPIFSESERVEALGLKECRMVKRGLHTYTVGNINIGVLMKTASLCYKGYLVILECEIPVGALYYEGHSNVLHSPYAEGFESETGYCSDRLRVIREVPLSEVGNICGSAI